MWLVLDGTRSLASGWQVTLCDPIWQTAPSSSEMACSGELYCLININVTCVIVDIMHTEKESH